MDLCAEDAAGLAPGKDDKQKYAGNTPLGAGSYGRAMLMVAGTGFGPAYNGV